MEPYINKNQSDNTDNPINEDINRFVNNIRRKLYSGRKLTFKEFLKKTEHLLDVL